MKVNKRINSKIELATYRKYNLNVLKQIQYTVKLNIKYRLLIKLI